MWFSDTVGVQQLARAITRQTQELLDMLFNLQQWFETKVCVNNISWINTISDIFIWSAEFRKWGVKFIVLSSALKWYKKVQFWLNFANIFALRYFELFTLESSNVYFPMRETNLKAQWYTNFFLNLDSAWSYSTIFGDILKLLKIQHLWKTRIDSDCIWQWAW